MLCPLGNRASKRIREEDHCLGEPGFGRTGTNTARTKAKGSGPGKNNFSLLVNWLFVTIFCFLRSWIGSIPGGKPANWGGIRDNDGWLPVYGGVGESFLGQYHDNRKLAHMGRVKVDKLKELCCLFLWIWWRLTLSWVVLQIEVIS